MITAPIRRNSYVKFTFALVLKILKTTSVTQRILCDKLLSYFRASNSRQYAVE